MFRLRFDRGARAGAALSLAALAGVASFPDAVPAQSAAPAVAVVSTPSGALPSVGLGAIGANRLTVGIRYGRLTDRYFIPADELSEEGTESYERDVYAGELSVGLFGGTVRLQGGRSHARWIYQRADTNEIASPHGVLASLGFARQLISLGAGSMRLGVGSDVGGGWADLSGVAALSAHGQLPISLRFSAESFGISTWAAPGVAWGSLAGETGTISTAAAGLRFELPNGTALDVAGTQLLGEHDAVWGGNRARVSIGLSHAFGGGPARKDPPGYRPRYGAGQDGDARPGEDARRPRPRTMPRDLDGAVAQDTSSELVQRHPAAIPQRASRPVSAQTPTPAPAPAAEVAAASAPASAPAPAPAAAAKPAESGRSIFYADETPAARPAPAPAAAAPAKSAPAPAAARPAATPAPAARGNAPAPAARFTVQAAAKKTNAEAVAIRDSLVTAGFPARIFSGPDYFRVRVGRFTTRAAAEAVAQRMRAAEFEAWVTTAEP